MILPLFVALFSTLPSLYAKSALSPYEKLFRHLRNSYNRYLRPGFPEPTVIDVNMYVASLRRLSETTMTYELELYFREYWHDERLMFDPEAYNNESKLSLHTSILNYLWVPDTFLPNAIESENPDWSSITHRSLVRLRSDGTLLISRRISVTAECPMDLTLYPFDRQICLLSIESYGYDAEQVIYRWKKAKGSPVRINPGTRLPQFKLVDLVTKSRNITLKTGTYSRLEACFYLKRSAGFYFVQIFFPATSMVIISWLFIWLQIHAAWRDTISVILAMTFIYYSYSTMMPKVSYIKAVDIYLTFCFMFVFLSLLKLTIMRLLEKRIEDALDLPSMAYGSLARSPTILSLGQPMSARLQRRAISAPGHPGKLPEDNLSWVESAKFPISKITNEDSQSWVGSAKLSVPKINIAEFDSDLVRSVAFDETESLVVEPTREQAESEVDSATLLEGHQGIIRAARLIRTTAMGIPISFAIFCISYFVGYNYFGSAIRPLYTCDFDD